MVFVIKSAVINFERRHAIRKTWSTIKAFEGARFEHVFIVGKSNQEDVNTKVIAENNAFGDILQFDQLDSIK